jgi:LuxR family transcriptional regulator, maltose regulon positive regulatory protein
MSGRSVGGVVAREQRSRRIAGTKLIPPPLPDSYAEESALVARVGRCVRGSTATVLRAPGGSGKTTLARAVVEALDLPWAWVTLDEWDDGLRLLELLHEALTRLGIDGPELRQLVTGTSTAFSAREAAAAVTNGLLDATVEPILLVLDDAHRLAAQVDAIALLAELMVVAPPSLHLLLTSRRPLAMPVARLEANGRLVEIDPDGLRVGVEQASRILSKMGVPMGEVDLERIVERTGGWVTGIRLVAADGHSVGTTQGAVGRYVGEELLTELPAEDARTLTDCAVLRRIRPAEVTALTGRLDARRWLQTVVDRLPVLVSALDDGAVQFHDLLRDTLLQELESDPDRLLRLHAAAADVVDDWHEQFHHLVAARSFERAVDILETRSRAVFPRPAPLAQVRTLMDRVPRDLWETRRWLRIVEGVALAHRAEHATAREILRDVASQLDEADVLARWAALRYLQRCGDDHPARSEQLQALEADPAFGDLGAVIRAEHEMSLAHGAMVIGRWDEVSVRHAAGVRTVMSSGDVGAAEVVSRNTSPFLALADGGVDRIDGFADWLDRRLDGASPLVTAGRDVHRALTAFLRGDLARAEVHAAATGDRLLELRLPYLRAQVDWVRVCALAVRGDLVPAVELLESRRRAGDPSEVPEEIAGAWIATLARLRREQDNHDELRALVRGSPEMALAAGPEAFLSHAVVAVLHAQLALAEGRAGDAVDVLTRAVDQLGPMRAIPMVGRLQLDLVVALAAAGRHDDALALLLDELVLLERLQAIGLVATVGADLSPVLERAIDVGSQVRAAHAARAVLVPDSPPAAVALRESGARLSSREVEVLRLLAAGYSNAQIAESLVLSVNTVKTHVRNVLRKLEVPTRAAAAGVARTLGIGDGVAAVPGSGHRRGSPHRG